MIDFNEKKVDTAIEQKKQGYLNPRKIRATRLNRGNSFAGWEALDNGQFVSPEDANGFRIRLKSQEGTIDFGGLVSIRNTAIPYSGTGSMSITHDTGTMILEIGGSGELLGSRYIIMRNADSSAYFAFIDNDDGTFSFELVGLPTSNPGPNKLWSNLGVVTIGT
jgi:hypothetical protein